MQVSSANVDKRGKNPTCEKCGGEEFTFAKTLGTIDRHFDEKTILSELASLKSEINLLVSKFKVDPTIEELDKLHQINNRLERGINAIEKKVQQDETEIKELAIRHVARAMLQRLTSIGSGFTEAEVEEKVRRGDYHEELSKVVLGELHKSVSHKKLRSLRESQSQTSESIRQLSTPDRAKAQIELNQRRTELTQLYARKQLELSRLRQHNELALAYCINCGRICGLAQDPSSTAIAEGLLKCTEQLLTSFDGLQRMLQSQIERHEAWQSKLSESIDRLTTTVERCSLEKISVSAEHTRYLVESLAGLRRDVGNVGVSNMMQNSTIIGELRK